MSIRSQAKSRFATPMHFAPTFPPTLTQVLAGVGLVAIGVAIGARLAPLLQAWNAQGGLKPRHSAPVRDIDRWANEGGAVAPPAFQKTP